MNKTIKECETKQIANGKGVDYRDVLAALYAALRWIDNDYRNHINNDGAYQAMMDDHTFGESYKDDITVIRRVINSI